VLKPFFLLTAKPAMYVANVSEHGFKGNPLLARVEEYAKKEGAPVVPISAALEAQIADLPDEDKQVFLADMGMKEPGLDRLIRAGTPCSACRPISPPGRRKCAPGPCKSAPPPRRPRE